jgi:SMC interacting uncharacterized protein involved in chromosome segregation
MPLLAYATEINTTSLFSLTIVELISGVVFIVGFMLSLWKVYDSFKKELHASLKDSSESIHSSLKEFEAKITSQIREEIKYSITLLENKQELRIGIAEEKVRQHEEELRLLRDCKLKIQLLENDLAGLKERLNHLEK